MSYIPSNTSLQKKNHTITVTCEAANADADTLIEIYCDYPPVNGAGPDETSVGESSLTAECVYEGYATYYPTCLVNGETTPSCKDSLRLFHG